MGESVCAPTSRIPVSASGRLPSRKATRLPCRTTKCWPPGAGSQRSVSASSVKPAPSSRRASSATAWEGEGEASTNARRSSPRASCRGQRRPVVVGAAVGCGKAWPHSRPRRSRARRWDAAACERAHADPLPPTRPALAAALEATGYLPDEGLATAAYLALAMHRPLFLEGEAGVGKTALAHALAEVTGRPIYRLQCYEGLEASQALYDWDFGRQLLHLRAAEAAHADARPTASWRPPSTTGGSCSPGRCCRR